MEQNKVTPERLMQFSFSFAPPLMLEAAVQLRVFDVLDGGPKTIEQVAAGTGASSRGLRALLNGLVGLELLAKQADTYCLTAESAAFLVSTKPGFRGGIFRHASRQMIPSWLQLTSVVRTGRPSIAVNQEATGGEFFQQFV